MIVVEPKPQENPGEVKVKDIFKDKTPKEDVTSRRGSVGRPTGIIHTRIYRTDDR